MKFIAEFCQNHNGDFKILERMVAEAAESGATHGKIQTIYASNLSFRPEFEAGLSVGEKIFAIKRPYKAEYERLKALELSSKDAEKFVRLCEKFQIVPMTTCFARNNLSEIEQVGFKSIKIASYDCASYVMIREIADKFDDIVISTGATYDSEIKKTCDILKGRSFELLHCVTQYPTSLDAMNLARMGWLKQFTDNVGLSDHSLVERDDVWACKVAIYLGATSLERHFTVLSADETKDGPVSITPAHMRELVRFSCLGNVEQESELDEQHKDWRIMVGESERKLTHEELLNRAYYRGRFGSPRPEAGGPSQLIYNWEETPFC
jgi:N,N'-diacetyllegionaminate synthase